MADMLVPPPVLPAAVDESADTTPVVGWYKFQWSGGEFAVCFRPGGKFYCAAYQALATWTAEGNRISIDFKEYGEYEMTYDPVTRTMEGCTAGLPRDWRKAVFVKSLSPVEVLLFGSGGGTAWNFDYKGGVLDVRFEADGFNTFACPQYPEQSHWAPWTLCECPGECECAGALDMHDAPGNMIEIDWGRHGIYVLAIDVTTKTMQGSRKGEPDDWRRATYVQDLSPCNCSAGCEHCDERVAAAMTAEA